MSHETDTLMDGYFKDLVNLTLEEIFKLKQSTHFITTSYIEICKNKILDNFNFDNNVLEYMNLKIQDYVDDICIDRVKEIRINSLANLDYMFK